MSSTQHQLIKQCATRLRGIVEALDNIHDSTPHRWSTDLDDVHSSAESLLALIKDQAPAPDARGLAQPSPAQAEQATADDYEEVLADHRRLVRELDVLLNGEEGAAKQASLCDLVGQVSAIVRERRVPLLSPSQAEAERLREAYEWGYGDGQNSPNGYSDKKERDACVNELLKQPSPAQAEGAPVIGCLCGIPMTEGHHSQDGCSSLEEFAQHSAQAQAEQGEAAGCQGTNCGTTTGDHSPECLAEAAASQGWELKPEDLGEVDVVAYLATAEHPKHGQPHKAINYSKYSHDAQVAHWRARGCTVTEDQLMTVSQHASSVALWADLFNRVQRERDAALARVAELEGKLTDWVHEGFRLNEALAIAQAQHSVPEGWKPVPIEPLLNMMSDKDHDTRIMAERQLLSILAAAPGNSVPQAWLDVQAERRRQITAEGWTPEHDDEHSHGQMARASACYALAGSSAPNDGTAALLVSLAWPWDEQWWKPTTPRRDLVKACALALAEIERLDRAGISQSPQPGATTASS
ncbi:hypothetical protein ACR9D1_001539 [Pseudomonas aeruginosa]